MGLKYMEIDFEKIWQEYMQEKEGYDRERAFNDNIERDFWKVLAPQYDSRSTLYDYSKEVYDFIDELIPPDKSIIEIGPGTGKFTIPLGKKCRRVIAVDFSSDMLEILKGKTRELNINNVDMLEGKWEDINLQEQDYILSVNSLYRIWNIKDALIKMNKLAREKVVIVRTIQKIFLNDLFVQLGFKDKTCLDYIYLPNILHSLNICANIRYIDVENEIEFESLEDIYSRIKDEVGEVEEKFIINEFVKRNFVNTGKKYIFTHKTKVEIIYWNSSKY
ncbi:class I SAM-dependent methyltransferase [Clostridium tagluense]|uniref:class I SAM-dependent methyltransferase n=1 Tax=Clostridium tagluense TaxID=360422 RepID=UPI001C0B2887|nr:class I SAM-dependent methyltransferase [Clostridium tagluense]MBU3129521.1 class I SAM-dependent methyltransferase [Clostridium tagluense]MCB2310885.1 class I SAM-dependent methyltransferase [Clostridium tagluense]MCB2315739.1 class I SAM-dependent methyltransferase [Clostridium tagluense]MCB2320617.1 class I SAM-dependent methyltransferase [Clostridium tagluense]MCB2325478.1 class I SAM-dependent methyltransferase [Clostridium tagluense]